MFERCFRGSMLSLVSLDKRPPHLVLTTGIWFGRNNTFERRLSVVVANSKVNVLLIDKQCQHSPEVLRVTVLRLLEARKPMQQGSTVGCGNVGVRTVLQEVAHDVEVLFSGIRVILALKTEEIKQEPINQSLVDVSVLV